MPITAYTILTAHTPDKLTTAVSDGGYVTIGSVLSGTSYGAQAVGTGTVDIGDETEVRYISRGSVVDLIHAVNEEINAGHQPVGSLSHWGSAYVQKVAKITPAAVSIPSATTSKVGGVKMAVAPKIELKDPPDSDDIAKNISAVVAVLQNAGVMSK